MSLFFPWARIRNGWSDCSLYCVEGLGKIGAFWGKARRRGRGMRQ